MKWSCLFFAVLSAWMAGCGHLFFYPDRNKYSNPGEFGAVFQGIEVGGLFGWEIEPHGTERGHVLFLHGNAGNISTHLDPPLLFARSGYRVTTVDYSGYGASNGEISVEQIHHDVRAMFRYFIKREPQETARVLVAQSLGASVALRVLSEAEFRGVFAAAIIDSPFASYREIAREVISDFWLGVPFSYPLSLLVSDRDSPEFFLPSPNLPPILVVHSESDLVVGVSHGEKLCEKIGAGCTMLRTEAVPHIGALSDVTYRGQIFSWLEMRVSAVVPASLR